jgi:transcriptional regulator with XRE-family HTH domain
MTLKEYLKRQIKEKGLTAKEIERRSKGKVTDTHIGAILAGTTKNPTVKIIVGIAEGLEVDPLEVFKAAASIHQEPGGPVWTPRTLAQTIEQVVDDEDLGRIVQSLAKQKPAKIKAVKKLLDIE